jgi:hypothetical protein
LLHAFAPQGGVSVREVEARELEAGRVELAEEALAVVLEDARRLLAAEGVAHGRGDEVQVAVGVHVREVLLLHVGDEVAFGEHQARPDRRTRASDADPARRCLVHEVAGAARLRAALVRPPAASLVRRLRRVGDVHVGIAVRVEVHELQVAALVGD